MNTLDAHTSISSQNGPSSPITGNDQKSFSVTTPSQPQFNLGTASPLAMPPLTLQARPASGLKPLPPDLFFDHSKQSYYLKMPGENWVPLKAWQLRTHLSQSYGLSPDSSNGDLSEVDEAIYRVEQYRAVDFVGAVGGYYEGELKQGKTRILVTSGPEFIDAKTGDWSMLRGILEKMLGAAQLPYLYGWLKVALQMFKAQTWMAGQVLVLCGPPMSGKNLLAFLIQKLFGGREPGKPYDYMTQGTSFNGDVVGAELLTIEDEVSHTDIKRRRAFGAKIKDLAVNKSRRLHKKYADGVTVVPLQRLIVSLNDEPERVMILPPIEPDIADKMMIFKVERQDMPMPTDTPQAEKAFGDALVAQLPAFVDFLDTWQISCDLKTSRTGIAHYHNPDILAMLDVQAPESQLLALIDEWVFSSQSPMKPWTGRAADIHRTLVGSSDRHIEQEAKKLVPTAICCGRYLGRLAERSSARVVRSGNHANTITWTIDPPAGSIVPRAVGCGVSAAVGKILERIKNSKSTQESEEAA